MKNEAGKKSGEIVMAHGGGGRLSRRLIDDIIVHELGNDMLNQLDDSVCLDMESGRIVFSTDSYVITPFMFPGGDIGKLAVCGTVNDLVMQGGRPMYLSLAFIVEEGFSRNDFSVIVKSIGSACREAGVMVVTGDTKVIERRRGGEGDGSGEPNVFINTAGIGVRIEGKDVSVANARPGDEVIVTGPLGDHGIAVMNARKSLNLRSDLKSDVAPLWGLVKQVLEGDFGIRCMRDPTRGGLAGALCDIAERSSCCIRIVESKLPIRPEVRGACDILGLDPLNVANEGKAVIVADKGSANEVLGVLKSHPLGRDASIIGEVVPDPKGRVLMTTRIGGERIVDVPLGDSLPRIC